jgi:hypothetical protein
MAVGIGWSSPVQGALLRSPAALALGDQYHARTDGKTAITKVIAVSDCMGLLV